MKMHVAQRRIGLLAFLGVQATHCMELTRVGSGARLGEVAGGPEGTGLMLKNSEQLLKTDVGSAHPNPAIDPYYMNHAEHISGTHPDELEGSVKNIDEQFKITQQSLNDLQQKMTDVVRYNKPRSAAYDEMASRFEQSATKLKSIQEEILKRPRFQDVMDNKDLVTRLWAALDATPQFRVRMAEGIDEAENMKLRDQARELHALIFQTIDFMQEKKLISPELLKEFFANSNSEQLLAGHFLLASKPEGSWGSGLDDAKLGFSKNLQANIPGLENQNTEHFRKLYVKFMRKSAQ